MTIAADGTVRSRDPAVRAMNRALLDAGDPQIRRIVAMVDGMMSRGAADGLIAPLRRRLVMLRPPRPLRFGRLMFHPLDPLIVPTARWRPGQLAIPRTAMMVMAAHVQALMGAQATPIVAALTGRTTADVDLIATLGCDLWPASVRLLATADRPSSWDATGLGAANYRPLVAVVTALLSHAVALETLCTNTANGLLPPRSDRIAAILTNLAIAGRAIHHTEADALAGHRLAMMVTLILNRLPAAAGLLPHGNTPAEHTAIRTASDHAADRLLRQLLDDEGTERRIAAGGLSDAAAAARHIVVLLGHLETRPGLRKPVLEVRRRLDAACKARFALGLQDELLAPLQQLGSALTARNVAALETAARGLRVLAIESSAVGSARPYDLLLAKATDAIKRGDMRDRLSLMDQVRLVEILAGPDAAMEWLERPMTRSGIDR